LYFIVARLVQLWVWSELQKSFPKQLICDSRNGGIHPTDDV
jgi:hypothetical protein